MATPYYDMIEKVHVMLVDDDQKFVAEMVNVLESYNYEVNTVDTTSKAMSMLSREKEKINVMIINIHSSNLLSFHILAQAVALDIISLVVCDEHNELVAKQALNEGANLYLKKPFDKKIVKYLWQFVLTKKIQKEKVTEGSTKNRDHMNADDIDDNYIIGDNEEQSEDRENASNTKKRRYNIDEIENNIVLNKKHKLKRKRDRINSEEMNEGECQKNAISKGVRQRTYTEWTKDLHAKFMDAVLQLGEGRCYPKDIVEVMNMPGLTRMQVASHLQKCRSNNWRAPGERRYIRHPSGKAFSSGSQQKGSIRKFGTMPSLQTNVSNLQCNPSQIERDSEFSFSTLNINNIFARGESSIQQQPYGPRPQVQSHYLDIDNLFNNPFLLAQNNVDGGLQQHRPFEMLDAQGSQDPIFENSNYKHGLAFNNRGHHTQSDYNLDINVAHGAIYLDREIISGTNIEGATINDYNLNANVNNVITYSSNRMMSDTYVENTTINGLGETNSDFQRHIDFNNVAYPIQNLGPPSASLRNEQGNESDQVHFDDQVAETSIIQFLDLENYPDKSSI